MLPVAYLADGTPVIVTQLVGSNIALPVDMQFSAVKSTLFTLASNISCVGDVARRWGNGSVGSTDWSGWGKQVWRVNNTHNQSVDITLNLVDVGDFNNAAGNPLKINIPANKTNVIITPADFAPLGYSFTDPVVLGFNATVAPTTGAITVFSYVSPII